VVIAPPLNNFSYHESTKLAYEKMNREAAQADLRPKDLINPKRDDFQALNVGLSYGQGHKKPALLELGCFQDLANALLGDVNIQRLASFQDGKSLTNWNLILI
jgi:hypothetical protein